MTEWEPATEAEAAMRDALRTGDQELYFRILGRVELLLPVSSDAHAGRAPMGWGTWTTGGRTHVLAFTSSQAMRACLAEHSGAARSVPYEDLASAWPNHEWWLAINPGLPIEGYLPAWFVAQLARGDVRLPGRTIGARARVEAAAAARARGAAAVPVSMASPAPTVSARSPVIAGSAPVPAQTEPLPRRPDPAAARADPPPAQRAAVPSQPVPSQPVPERISEPPPVPAPARAEPEQPPFEPAAVEPATFEPANEVEADLLAAATDGHTDSFLSTLLLAKVLIPVRRGGSTSTRPGDPGFEWRREEVDGQPYVVVFTSAERLSEYLGADTEAVATKFVQLIRVWPDDAWSFAVNPGTAVGATLPGGQIRALAAWAAEVGLTDEPSVEFDAATAAAAAAAAPPTERDVVMQKPVAPTQVAYFLERGYDRVSGFVHRATEVSHLSTPEQMYTALGLGYAGSPFKPSDDEVYVLRWTAYRPNLYRVPFGGRDEAGMRAMQGWMIERAPFRGNGFAPGESTDVIAEFKVDSARLPHGAQMWRVGRDGTETLVAMLDSDGPRWMPVGPDPAGGEERY